MKTSRAPFNRMSEKFTAETAVLHCQALFAGQFDAAERIHVVEWSNADSAFARNAWRFLNVGRVELRDTRQRM